MFDLKEEQQQLALSESHILALQERAATLKGKVDQMLENGQDAQAQLELLCTMLDVLKSLEFVRMQIAGRLSRGEQRFAMRRNSE